MLSTPKIIIRNRFQSFLKHKHELRRKSHRFAKTPKKHHKTEDIELLDKSNLIEIPTMSSLPPQWVDQYQQCSAILTEITTLRKEISQLNARRLRAQKERQEAQIDKEIYEKVTEVTSKIRSCQGLLKVISASQKGNSQDERLCNNMCRGLIVELQEKARDLRIQQRNHLDRRRKLEGATKVSFLELAADKQLAEDYVQQKLEEEEIHLNLDVRNKEVLKLVESIHGLHQVYKELSNMVIAQGTILDRIDYNIDQTCQNVSKAKTNLQKAAEHQKSPLACRCIVSLIIIIVALLIVMIVKYTR